MLLASPATQESGRGSPEFWLLCLRRLPICVRQLHTVLKGRARQSVSVSVRASAVALTVAGELEEAAKTQISHLQQAALHHFMLLRRTLYVCVSLLRCPALPCPALLLSLDWGCSWSRRLVYNLSHPLLSASSLFRSSFAGSLAHTPLGWGCCYAAANCAAQMLLRCC